jgi:hypothetical protein
VAESGPLPVEAEPRPRPARVRRRRALRSSSQARGPPSGLCREASSVLIQRSHLPVAGGVCAPRMPLSQAGCPRPVRWLLVCAVATALAGLLGGAVSENGRLRQGPAATRGAPARRGVLMLPSLQGRREGGEARSAVAYSL